MRFRALRPPVEPLRRGSSSRWRHPIDSRIPRSRLNRQLRAEHGQIHIDTCLQSFPETAFGVGGACVAGPVPDKLALQKASRQLRSLVEGLHCNAERTTSCQRDAPCDAMCFGRPRPSLCPLAFRNPWPLCCLSRGPSCIAMPCINEMKCLRRSKVGESRRVFAGSPLAHSSSTLVLLPAMCRMHVVI